MDDLGDTYMRDWTGTIVGPPNVRRKRKEKMMETEEEEENDGDLDLTLSLSRSPSPPPTPQKILSTPQKNTPDGARLSDLPNQDRLRSRLSGQGKGE